MGRRASAWCGSLVRSSGWPFPCITPERGGLLTWMMRDWWITRGQQPWIQWFKLMGRRPTSRPCQLYGRGSQESGLRLLACLTMGPSANHIMYQNLYYLTNTIQRLRYFIHVLYVTEQVVDKPGQSPTALADIVSGSDGLLRDHCSLPRQDRCSSRAAKSTS